MATISAKAGFRMERRIEWNIGTQPVAASLHYPDTDREGSRDTRFPAVVVCHGFIGDRIGPHRLFVRAARTLEQEGYAALRFDYAGCGESGGDYGASVLNDWVGQTRYALDYMLDLDFINPERVTLLGHGLGAAVAIRTAVLDRRVRSLVLWAPVGHPFQDMADVVGRAAYEEAVIKGETEYAGYRLRHSLFQSLAESHPLQEARQTTGDVLLIHGASDEAVSVDYSVLYQKVLWTRSDGQCDQEIVAQANHAFSTRGHADFIIRKTADWLQRREKEKQEWYGWMI